MKKALFIFGSLGLGGSQKIEAFVANTCKKEGYEVSVISLTDHIPVGVDLDKSIPIQYVHYDRRRDLRGIVKRLPFIMKLRGEIRKCSPDVICVFLADVTRVVAYACSGLKIPIIGSERNAPGRHGSRLSKYNRSFARCRYVVFQTETAKKYYRLEEDRTKVIPNPCFLRWGDIEDPPLKEKTICAAGRLCGQKRFDVLIDAFSIVRKTHPEYQLYIYGSGKLREELQKQIEKAGLTGSVFMPGYVEDVFRTHGKPEIFVLSSDYEGIPNILMEAMSLGIPCAATDCEPGGAAMLFDHERRGLLSPAGDSRGLAKNINQIIERKDLAASLGENAREVTRVFSVERIQSMWMELFHRL